MKLLLALISLFALCFSPSANAAASFDDRMEEVGKAVNSKRAAGQEAFMDELQRQGEALARDFPDRSEPYEILLSVVMQVEPDKAPGILKLLSSPKAPEQIRELAAGIRKKLDAVGKPLALNFRAHDGREVNLEKMRGKVVLIDFWASWCQPCMEALPELKVLHSKLGPRGFEVLGIDLDNDAAAMEEVIKEQKIPWPQHFDGKGSKNEIAAKYGITAIPEVWLVDQKGVLRDIRAREDLAGKVERLLAEK
jgi:thiol-disulfide isomerase/thioredoxin